jgi:hypothetical protein
MPLSETGASANVCKEPGARDLRGRMKVSPHRVCWADKRLQNENALTDP